MFLFRGAHPPLYKCSAGWQLAVQYDRLQPVESASVLNRSPGNLNGRSERRTNSRCNQVDKGMKVRIIFAAITFLFLSVNVIGQTPSPSPTPTPSPTPEFKQEFYPQITNLPIQKGFFPKLSLAEALTVIERHLKKEKIDLLGSYLAEVKLIIYGEGPVKERIWVFTWAHSRAAGLTTLYSVSMDGKVKRHPHM